MVEHGAERRRRRTRKEKKKITDIQQGLSKEGKRDRKVEALGSLSSLVKIVLPFSLGYVPFHSEAQLNSTRLGSTRPSLSPSPFCSLFSPFPLLVFDRAR